MCSAAGALQIQHFTFSSAGFFILLVLCVNIFLLTLTLRCCCKDKIFCSECLLWNHCVSEYSAQRTHVTAQFYQTRNSAFESVIKSYIFIIIIDECDTCRLAINPDPDNHEYDTSTKLELDSTMSQSWIEFGNWILNFNLKQFVLVRWVYCENLS